MNRSLSRSASSAKKAGVLLLSAAQLMIMLDTSIVHVALPSIQADLGASAHTLRWTVAAYSLAFGGFVTLGGRLGDLIGRRRMLSIGLALYTLASGLGGFAADAGTLIAARALQGLGAAVIAPSVLSLISGAYPEGDGRNRALGVLGAVSSSGFIAGLVLGGVLTELAGWRSIFFVNIPAGGAVMLLAPFLIKESERLRQPVDLAGAVSATAGLTLLVYACSNAGEHGFASPGTWLSFLAASLALGACVLVESRTPHPLFPPDMFRNRSFAGALAAAIAFGSIMGPSLFMLTFYLQNALGFGPLAAGAGFLPQEIAVIAAAPLIGTVIAKTGTKRVLAAGMVGLGAGVLTLAGLEADGSYWRVMAGLIFIGLGTACVIVGGSVAAMSRLSPQQQGLASGLWHAAPQLGAAVGLAVLISVADAFAGGALRAGPDPSHAPIDAAVAGFRMAFLSATAFAAIGLWCVLRWLRPAPASRDSER